MLTWQTHFDPAWLATSTSRLSETPGCEGDLEQYTVTVDTDGLFAVTIDSVAEPSARLETMAAAKAWCAARDAGTTGSTP